MAVKGKTFEGQDVSSIDDGMLYQAVIQDGVLTGCAVTVSADTVHIARGAIIAGGRVVVIDGGETYTPGDLEQSGYMRLVYKINLAIEPEEGTWAQGTWEHDYSATTTFLPLTQGDINGGGDAVYEVELCVVSITNGTLTDVVRSLPKVPNQRDMVLKAGDTMTGPLSFAGSNGVRLTRYDGTQIIVLAMSGGENDNLWLGALGPSGAAPTGNIYLRCGVGMHGMVGRGEQGQGNYTASKIWDAGNDGAGSGLDADMLDGQHAAAFAAASHSHQRINRDDGKGVGVNPDGALVPMQDGDYVAGGQIGTSAYTLNRIWGIYLVRGGGLNKGYGIYNDGALVPCDGTGWGTHSPELGKAAYQFNRFWGIFWVRGGTNKGVGIHPDGALVPCDAESWADTHMDLGTSNYKYGTLYLSDTVRADRLKTADASSSPNMIVDENGTVRRTSGSSRRFKRDIVDMPDDGADKVLQLRPRNFRFREEFDPYGRSRGGFIAEEVIDVAPEYVDWTELEDGTIQCDNVRYGEITAGLVKLVQRQQEQIEQLTAAVEALMAVADK